MFRGNHPTRIDDRGRLKLPAEFKRLVDERYNNQFYVTSRDGWAADIYPMAEWQRIEEKIALVPNSNPAKKKLLSLVNYYGQTAEMDAQGRVLIHPLLREKANIVGDALAFGMQTFIQLVNRDRFIQRLEVEPLTVSDEKELEGFGL
jgi:MraZ protein